VLSAFKAVLSAFKAVLWAQDGEATVPFAGCMAGEGGLGAVWGFAVTRRLEGVFGLCVVVA
jgi:hypothetical protein